jgi:hypothetical protein
MDGSFGEEGWDDTQTSKLVDSVKLTLIHHKRGRQRISAGFGCQVDPERGLARARFSFSAT